MDDEEDVKKMVELIKSSQEDATEDFQYDDFINCENIENSDIEEVNEEIIYFENYDFSNFTGTDISKLNSYDPTSTLKPEERLVIDSCSDPELKHLLLLNRTKNFQLMQLYKKLKDLLIQCQKDIEGRKEAISNFMKANKERAYSSGAWRLGAPYFKDKRLYSCPPNADTLRKQKNKELNIYDITLVMKWSSLECEKLIRAVKLNYNINQQSNVMKKIKACQETDNTDELTELEQRMEELQDEDNSEIPPLNSDQHIDWLRLTDVFLGDRRSAFDCKSFWHIYLHPHINKSPWTPEENTKLKKLVRKYKYQNWSKIAEELGNNRTGFTSCMNYFSNLHERFKKGEFTDEEDSRLVQMVHRYKMGNYIPWVRVVQHFKRRTRAQLHHRYTYYLTQNDKKKGKFTDAEDILLMVLVDKFGKNFKKCSEYFPTRSMVQIKSRYNSNLQQKLKKGSFTKEDDEIILKYAEEHGEKSWTTLTKLLQRCRGQIRQRYNTIKAYLAKYPNSTLEDVPRRKHNQMEAEDPFNFLRTVADQFVDSPDIPTLHKIEKILNNHHQEELIIDNVTDTLENINILRSPVSIDDMLTNFFCNSFKMNPAKCISSAYVKKAAKDVQAVLGAFKADIDIPQNFDEDLRLDNLDVAILNILADKAVDKSETKKDICQLLPPNLNSLVGLRSLLIKYYTNKLNNEEMNKIVRAERNHCLTINVRSNIIKHLLTLSDETRLNVENDRKLFYKRFHGLFKWPAIMTLVNPSPNLQGSSSSNTVPRKIQAERTYSRANRNKVTEDPKIQINNSELPVVRQIQVQRTYSTANSNKVTEGSKKQINNSELPIVRQIQAERTYSTANSSKVTEGSKKQMNISELPSSSTKAVPLKLTPVTNQSVLADLMQNKNKKLFSMESIKCGNETKTIIKEINIRADDSRRLLNETKSNTNDTKTADKVKEKVVDSGASMPSSGSNCDEPSSKKRKLCNFVPEHGECIILNMEDDYMSSDGEECSGTGKDDLKDLNRLEAFLEQHQDKEVPKDDDDLEDLKKLEHFLKEQGDVETF